MDLRSVVHGQREPLLCRGDFFPALDLSMFSPLKLQQLLAEESLKFRSGKRDPTSLQWEGSCPVREAKVADIIAWNSISDCKNTDENEKKLQEKLSACCKQHYWLYADYMYMKDVFYSRPGVLKLMDWDALGFTGKSGVDSTMWIGTVGAHTLCHYDTYGYNIVLQISGSKRWTLFPPSDAEYLYPTRIPYEESSVFSEVNISEPDLGKHPKFSSASPRVVVLQAGDILYVPHHWWHFVENLELSVSINLWYETEGDSESRLDEAITRLLFGTCCHVPSSRPQWLNPNEDEESVKSVDQNMTYLRQSIKEVQLVKNDHRKRVSTPTPDQTPNFSIQRVLPVKRSCGTETKETEVSLANSDRDQHFTSKPETGPRLSNFDCGSVTNVSADPPKKKARVSEGEEVDSPSLRGFNYTDFVQCLTHPDVVSVIARLVSERCSNDSSMG